LCPFKNTAKHDTLEFTWCERGDSNPHGFTRQILSSSRTKIQQLARRAMKCDQLPQMPCPVELSGDAITIGSTRSGLVVGTKLGTKKECHFVGAGGRSTPTPLTCSAPASGSLLAVQYCTLENLRSDPHLLALVHSLRGSS